MSDNIAGFGGDFHTDSKSIVVVVTSEREGGVPGIETHGSGVEIVTGSGDDGDCFIASALK